MSNGLLSQEELDALMSGKPAQPPLSPQPPQIFGEKELDALGEISNISMGAAATALATIIDKKVEVTAPKVELAELRSLNQGMDQNIFIVVDFVSGFKGSSVLILSHQDGGTIIDLLMGGDGQNPPRTFNEIHLSAVAEGMNQMMGSSATSLSTLLDTEVRVSPPKVSLEQPEGFDAIFPKGQDQVVKVTIDLNVEGLISTNLVQIYPLSVAQEMVTSKLGQVQQSLGGSPIPRLEPAHQQNQAKPETITPISSNFQVRPAQFAPLQPSAGKGDITNLGLILDVPIEISVQLGKAYKTIKEILDFAPGSIIELDKLAGESVDLIANGKLLAKGEVVVINENFGVRITEIESSLDTKLSN